MTVLGTYMKKGGNFSLEDLRYLKSGDFSTLKVFQTKLEHWQK